MSGQREEKPSSVSATTKQGGEGTYRWYWTEPSVWKERMLTALEEGVKGDKWFSLIDKVYREANLRVSYSKVLANKGASGVDHVTVEAFGKRLEENLKEIIGDLRSGSYEPQAIRRVYIPKPGSKEQRPLGIPTVRDRVVQGAIRHVIEPIFEKEFAEHSYGFRPGKGCKDALRRVDELLRSGHAYVVDVDLKRYFDTIPHARMMNRLRERIADGELLSLIEKFLKARIMEEMEEYETEEGTPQGAIISPLLSNIYLNPLDHRMEKEGHRMVRYADDFVILCRTEAEAREALEKVRKWCEAEGLTLHPTKTRIVDVRKDGFDFLGYNFQEKPKQGLVRMPAKKSMEKVKANLRAKTRSTNGKSLRRIIEGINRTIWGWFGYFKHCHKWTFSRMDGWIRRRLRSIQKKRSGRAGVAKGSDNLRWPNAFFATNGLICLEEAHSLASQSCSR